MNKLLVCKDQTELNGWSLSWWKRIWDSFTYFIKRGLTVGKSLGAERRQRTGAQTLSQNQTLKNVPFLESYGKRHAVPADGTALWRSIWENSALWDIWQTLITNGLFTLKTVKLRLMYTVLFKTLSLWFFLKKFIILFSKKTLNCNNNNKQINKLHFKIYYNYFKLIIFLNLIIFLCISDQINVALVSKRDFLQKH